MYEQTEQTESSCGLVDVDRIEPDQLKRWAQWTSLGIIAVDLATGVVLKTGNGRRRAGGLHDTLFGRRRHFFQLVTLINAK